LAYKQNFYEVLALNRHGLSLDLVSALFFKENTGLDVGYIEH
jgi:hypothetical protein